MAIIYQGKNHRKEAIENKRQIRARKTKKALIIFLISLIISLIFLFYSFNTFFIISSMVILIIIFALFISAYSSFVSPSDYFGELGEQKALEILSQLDDTYTIFTNIDIYFKERISQVDNIIICRNGIFIVEVKNMRGHIKGNVTDEYLTQEKVSKYGNRYTRDFYNPIKQVGTHIYQLSNLLKSYNIYQYINGIILFVNEESIIEVESDNIPVFHINNIEDLFDYIKTNTITISKKEQNLIIEILLTM